MIFSNFKKHEKYKYIRTNNVCNPQVFFLIFVWFVGLEGIFFNFARKPF